MGEEGIGRLAEPARLLAACERLLRPRAAEVGTLAGVRVLITAGGTREPIDSVRFIGNRSSGLMGLALADVASARGASVTLIAANVAAPAPAGVRTIRVGTAAEMQSACESEFAGCDVLLMAAAVADYRPRSVENGKIDKSARDRLALELEPTADVLSALSARRTEGQMIVGFAAEHGEHGVERARGKLTAKGLDAVVVNDISRSDIGFEVDANEVTFVTRAEDVHVPMGSKAQVAEAILDVLATLRTSS
jgi:phosphopantothenoylcysteine decarboxylase/phosphopantothenate--cysteine ligase